MHTHIQSHKQIFFFFKWSSLGYKETLSTLQASSVPTYCLQAPHPDSVSPRCFTPHPIRPVGYFLPGCSGVLSRSGAFSEHRRNPSFLCLPVPWQGSGHIELATSKCLFLKYMVGSSVQTSSLLFNHLASLRPNGIPASQIF